MKIDLFVDFIFKTTATNSLLNFLIEFLQFGILYTKAKHRFISIHQMKKKIK